MIAGVGIDMVAIDRVKKAIQNAHFYERVFSQEERTELAEKKAESAAACFCAKEAFGKALGCGVRGFSLSEVSLLHHENGQPYLKLSGRAQALAQSSGITQFHASVSHTHHHAVCMVIAER